MKASLEINGSSEAAAALADRVVKKRKGYLHET